MNQPVTLPGESPGTAHLVVQLGPQPGQTFDITAAQITIGRSPANEISIPDPEISRKHARLVRQGAEYAVEDLGSTNGTFVNDRRIVGLTPLHDGDIIEPGEAVRLLYEAESTLPIELPGLPPSAAQPAARSPQYKPEARPPAAPPRSWRPQCQ
ncbi:MAG: FHA domain-containing protein [Chloroflexi bacterium]|nr:FHA domain-containing protein [Chloroflexota bacterium]